VLANLSRAARLLAPAVLCLALSNGAAAAAPGAPVVTTVAGDGRLGLTDGDALLSSFYVPAGVAVGPDGDVYVADSGAQNVRRILGGRVETFAGASAGAGAGQDARQGGYADGPAATAQFDRPVALAVARDGTVYVADAGNHCIRRIADGVVTTLAGSTHAGSGDGLGRAAEFENLKGLALDDDGTLYAADYGVGIRKITPAGRVTTLSVPSEKKTFVAVAARGAGNRVILAFADSESFGVLYRGKFSGAHYDDAREPESSGLTVGYADGIGILNENTVVVSDVATNAVRFVRLPSPPFITDRMTRALAGGIREGGDDAGGYADGPPERALVNTPLGLAVAPDGSIVVADAGNRRIRRIAGIDARETVLPDGSNLAFSPGAYNVAIIGNSYAFYNVLWPESIPGRLESSLTRFGPAAGLKKRVHVEPFRIDALDLGAAKSLIDGYLGDGQVDLVVLMVNSYTISDAARLTAIANRLESVHTKFLLMYTPQGYEVSPLEFVKADVARAEDVFAGHRDNAARTESFYNSVHVESLLLLDEMAQEEAKPDRRSLFYTANHHLTLYGTEWVAGELLEKLVIWKPWK
jgi:sugar lactone lactonase YvrE